MTNFPDFLKAVYRSINGFSKILELQCHELYQMKTAFIKLKLTYVEIHFYIIS